MKVKDILPLVKDNYAVICVGKKIYDYNSGFFPSHRIKRQKGFLGHYKTSIEEENSVLNEEVVYIGSDKSGVIHICTKNDIS